MIPRAWLAQRTAGVTLAAVSSLGPGDELRAGAADFFGNQRFQLRECLGAGSYGVVYEAYDRVRDTTVALKVLRHLGPDALFYFKKEFRSVADLQHPNLVRYGELFEERGRWFMTMELVEGQPLMQWVRAGRRAPVSGRESEPCFVESRVRSMLVQMGRGLVALHATGAVHRDVKPSNLRVTPDGRVVLLDFGLVLEPGAHESARLPRVGTMAHMAPEQGLGREVGPPADWYSLGSVLYECLTGRHPYVGEALDVLHQKQTRDPDPPSNLAPGVPPDLDEVCMGLLARTPTDRSAGIDALLEMLTREQNSSDIPSTRPRDGRLFVGRQRELEQLMELMASVEERQLAVAYLYGESGVGKTALLTELSRRLTQQWPEAVQLRGRCYERETVPYKAFDGIVDALARHLRYLPAQEAEALMPRHVGHLSRVFPVMGRVPAIQAASSAGSRSADTMTLRKQAFAALRELLGRIAERQPLVLTIDDAHWADEDSLLLMHELLSPPRAPAMLLVCTGRARPVPSDPVGRAMVSLLDMADQSMRLRLGALSPAEARAVAEALLRDAGAPTSMAGNVARESAGLPVFIDALVRHARRGEQAPSLDGALSAALADLPDDARRLLDVLAVAGAPVPWDALGRASGLKPGVFASAVDRLRLARWVQVRRDDGPRELECIHGRVRVLSLARLSDDGVRQLHAALAEALGRGGGDPEAVAQHWAEAGDSERAFRYANRAAQAAERALALGRAAQLYRLASAHCPEGKERLSLDSRLARVLALDGRAREAADLYTELAGRLPPGLHAQQLRYEAARMWFDCGELQEGHRVCVDLLQELGERLPRTRGAAWRSLLVNNVRLWSRGLRHDARRAEDLDPRDILRVDVLWTMTVGMILLDEVRSADIQARHVLQALDLGEPYRASRALAMQAWFVRGALRGRDIQQSAELKLARDLAAECDNPHAQIFVELVDGVSAYLSGHFNEAAALTARAEQRLREDSCGTVFERGNAQLFSALCAQVLGQWPALIRRVPDLVREADGRQDMHNAAVLRLRLLYFVHLLKGEPEEARSELRRAVEQAPGQPMTMHALNQMCSQADIDLYLGDPNAHARIQERWNSLERSMVLRTQVLRSRALHARARAALCSAYRLEHQRSKLLALARKDAAQLSRERLAYCQAHARLIEAAAAEVAEQRERAIGLYGEAVVLSEEAEMPQYAEAARRRQGLLIGGEEGARAIGQAESRLRASGAAVPARIAAVLVGF